MEPCDVFTLNGPCLFLVHPPLMAGYLITWVNCHAKQRRPCNCPFFAKTCALHIAALPYL